MTAPAHPTRLPRTTQLSLVLDDGELQNLTGSERDQAVHQLAWLLLEAAGLKRDEDPDDDA